MLDSGEWANIIDIVATVIIIGALIGIIAMCGGC